MQRRKRPIFFASLGRVGEERLLVIGNISILWYNSNARSVFPREKVKSMIDRLFACKRKHAKLEYPSPYLTPAIFPASPRSRVLGRTKKCCGKGLAKVLSRRCSFTDGEKKIDERTASPYQIWRVLYVSALYRYHTLSILHIVCSLFH